MINYEVTELKGMRAGAIPITEIVRSMFVSQIRGIPIPPENRETGCDISHWNGEVYFPIMYSAGARFVAIKATQGVTIVDKQYLCSRTRLGGIMPFASYHFCTPANGTAQAIWFAETIKDNPGVLPRILDVEVVGIGANIIKDMVIQLYKIFGDMPLIYTSDYFWRSVVGETDKRWISDRCGLHVAHWKTLSPILPTGWSTYILHQFSADKNNLGQTYGAPPGAEPDMDLNYCRKNWLQLYNPEPTLADRVADLERRVSIIEERLGI